MKIMDVFMVQAGERGDAVALIESKEGEAHSLTFAEIENIHSCHANDAEIGTMFEIDVAFWIPLLSERNGKAEMESCPSSVRMNKVWSSPLRYLL